MAFFFPIPPSYHTKICCFHLWVSVSFLEKTRPVIQNLGSCLIWFCISQTMLDSLHLSPHMPILRRKQFSFKSNITLESESTVIMLRLHRAKPLKLHLSSLTFMRLPLCVQYIQNGNAHGDMFISIQQSAVRFSIMPYHRTPQSNLNCSCPFVYLRFVSSLYVSLGVPLFSVKLTDFLHILRDRNHSTSELRVGFF